LDTAIYHCQQTAEKSVKGFLVHCDHEFERVHDVEALIRAALPYEAGFMAYLDIGRMLTPYSRIYRYPGTATQPDDDQFDRAYEAASSLFDFVLLLLPIDTHPMRLDAEADIEASHS
jgi:HEPN domain-containing protein